MKNKKIQPSLTEAIIVLAIIICSISLGVIGWKVSPSTAILFSIGITMLYGVSKHADFSAIHHGIVKGIEPGIIPIFIFILVGALIAVWIKAGIIPALMVIGFKVLSVKWFIPSIFVACAIVGSAVGSAFTVMSTLGIAFFGIGKALGFDQALIVGAIVSGAVFGDKMSPLSESTNLAAAVVEADLFKHIKNLMWSTIPAFIFSLIVFSFLGVSSKTASLQAIQRITSVLEHNFPISPLALIPILLMLICAWKKIPAIMTILLNIAVSVGMILWQQPVSLTTIGALIESGFKSQTGDRQIDLLLTRGGIESMMPTVALIIVALSLGGLLLEFNLISTVMNRLANRLKTARSLIIATLLTAIGVNIFVGEQFLSVILPGSSFKEIFKQQQLDPVVLGRTLEDGGTVINYLIPWGVAGSFVAGTFGVPVLDYLPFALFSLLSPLFSLISALTGIGVKHQLTD
ncbi:Na+/H+ antiporter NhaC [Liquorilactobacillus nagelii]|jgi:NhaC family Na+:H+ antiporter|uniref:Na+/H+ antiporter NhaC n=1 Tax=Liquorilactobacillus nagelii TaxID=82688 RepID=UPI001CD02F5B|nr:Na+/H+ antiporter NhaC [Liquorilactobacillus nagelii]ULQ48580.1 Na+/H+ antiporter NhaC [Liquorilactobacillus nagelii]